ncbi:ATP-binding protein [Roseibium salinum]|uniref:histidine kinase n=1 Tax=Roseibium salinum TaxID=1604349 RepID=A0ABT3R9F4_9HYPH|nr:ATP-binding protein [Roseibium sp. DSM 29163]MCX2725696.1 ATP-binding protein [Roseibium sp. DSM 29163]
MILRSDMPADRADGTPPRQGDSSPDMLREVIEAMSEGLALFDEEARLVRCNAGYRELNPLIADLLEPGIGWELILRECGLRGALSSETLDRLRWMENRLATGADTSALLEIELSNGAMHEIAMRQTPVGGFVVTQSDLTDKRQYEEHERQADILLRKVLEACPANVVMSRIGDGHIIYRSPAATELLGTTHNSQEHFASREERADFVTALLPDGRVDDMLVTGVRPNGSTFPCAVSARVIDYRGEEVVVSSTVDMSREVEMQKKLAEQREQIFQAEKMSALGELLAGVAHELNNPLSVVVGHALMMREETADPEVLRRLEKISEAAERCARIVKSFLAMARQQPARLAPMDLEETIEIAIEALRNGASGLKASVEIDLARNLPSIQGDADQLVQVLINLITNADQAIAASGTGDRITISSTFDKAAGMIELRVSDNGPGVPSSIRSRIFDPLFTTKEVGQGTGIGLAFCHRVITSHNGQIRLESAPGKGATFVLRLPVSSLQTAADSLSQSEAGAVSATRVLVVDDEADVADLIREILQRDGYRVDYAQSVETALSLARKQAYALILSDLNMPGIGGRGFYEIIARDLPEMADRVGFVTGDTMSPSARGFLDSADRPYLEKPIAPSELRALAQRMLEHARGGGHK